MWKFTSVAGNTTNVELGNVELGLYEEEVHVSGVKSKNEENGWYDVVLKMAPCISVVLYTFSYGAGFGPAIYTWTSELFPSKLKGVGSSIALARYFLKLNISSLLLFLQNQQELKQELNIS